ncbi:VOC family protein [Pseudooceanicola sp. CBS1P-1]|nr:MULTISPECIES: VOC family protein [Pseudooceanicola]MBT9384554.1 VOC family protein [Pseudooceanicola endophyticus]
MAIYLFFDGTARAAIDFYKATLGAEVKALMPFSDLPDGTPLPPGMEDRVMHALLQIGDQTVMISDTMSPEAQTRHSGFNMQMSLPDPEEAARLFAALSEGGEVTMAFAPTFWAAGFGTCTDRFGIPWMVNCDLPAT